MTRGAQTATQIRKNKVKDYLHYLQVFQNNLHYVGHFIFDASSMKKSVNLGRFTVLEPSNMERSFHLNPSVRPLNRTGRQWKI